MGWLIAFSRAGFASQAVRLSPSFLLDRHMSLASLPISRLMTKKRKRNRVDQRATGRRIAGHVKSHSICFTALGPSLA